MSGNLDEQTEMSGRPDAGKRRRDGRAPRNPLKRLASQAGGLRALCAGIEALSGRYSVADLDAFVIRLLHDLPLHFADESDDLLPLLSLRAHRDDDVSHVVETMTANHRDAVIEIRRLRPRVEALRLMGGAPADDPSLGTGLDGLLARLRHHLSLEIAVILPIARLRLTEDDLRHMAAGMAARRKAAGI